MSDNIHQYIIDCLKSAVAYCKSQYQDSSIDWLPTIAFIDNEADESYKFILCDTFLANL